MKARLCLFLQIIISMVMFSSFAEENNVEVAEVYSEKNKLAENVQMWNSNPKWNFCLGLSIENGTDYSINQVGMDFMSNLDMKVFDFSIGCKVLNQVADLTVKTVYWPCFYNCFYAGVGNIVHSQFYSHEYLEIDLLSGLFLKYDAKKVFSAELDFCYHLKSACIYEIKNEIPWIKNHSIAFHAGVGVNVTKFFALTFDFSSYSEYRYFLFFAPDFKLGLKFHADNNWSAGLDVECQYIDLFTLSANFNSFTARAYICLSI